MTPVHACECVNVAQRRPEGPVYTQNLNPTGSLALSALLASLPLLALLVAL